MGFKKFKVTLAAILMALHLKRHCFGPFFYYKRKINFIKVLGVLVGFSGIVFLFSDNILINENNFISAVLILAGSTFYVIGGLLTLKVSNKENENVTSSILIWAQYLIANKSILSYKNPSEASMFKKIYIFLID